MSGNPIGIRAPFAAHLIRALCIAACAPAAGCSSDHEIVRIDNAERAATVWKKEGPKSCLEYSTAAETLSKHSAALAGSLPAGQKLELSFESSQNLAQIYTVSDIMQFGHAALYRLCEAAANKEIPADKYETLFQDTLSKLTDLLLAQIAVNRATVATELGAVKAEIDSTRQKRAALDPKDPNAQARIKQLDRQLDALEQRRDMLLRLGAPLTPDSDSSPPASTTVPDAVPEKPAEPGPNGPAVGPKPPASPKPGKP